jgi:lysophospholipase L1-like esterase
MALQNDLDRAAPGGASHYHWATIARPVGREEAATMAGIYKQTIADRPPTIEALPQTAHPYGREEADGATGCRLIVVMGDSLAAGLGDQVPGLDIVGWADRLALALRATRAGISITNLAQSGCGIAEIARTQLVRTLALHPELIIVTAGGVDLLARTWSPHAFWRSYSALLERLVASGATVLTTTWHDVPRAVPMPPALAYHASRRLCEAGTVVRRVSEDLGTPCLDFWNMPTLLDAGCYSADGIHPNARGYLRVAGVIASGVHRYAGLQVPYIALRTQQERRRRARTAHGWRTAFSWPVVARRGSALRLSGPGGGKTRRIHARRLRIGRESHAPTP